MKKNRKKTDTYRFNGNPGLHAGSIRSVTMADLEILMKQFEAKLADPHDSDDKKWTARWLERFRKEHEKKREGLGRKQREKQVRRRAQWKAER
jgi:hypothetical protein